MDKLKSGKKKKLQIYDNEFLEIIKNDKELSAEDNKYLPNLRIGRN